MSDEDFDPDEAEYWRLRDVVGLTHDEACRELRRRDLEGESTY